MPSQLPYAIFGIVYDTDGSTVVNGATVRARNETNNNIISTTSDSEGQYGLDLSNFADGYLGTDKVTVYVIYSNLDASGTIDISDDEHEKNLTLATIADSSLVYYCTVQDVFDELDISDSDLTAQRIIKVIQRSEARIEERTRTKFKSTTVTEYYDFNQYNGFRSPEQMDSLSYTIRHDHWKTNCFNKFRLNHFPVISITTLWKNSAGASQADSWTSLTEQTGSGGDYEVDYDTGWTTFVNTIPRFGKRSMKVTYAYGWSTVPKQVERLVILLSVADIIRMRSSYASFSAAEDISIESLSIRNNAGSTGSYLRNLQEEINRAWEEVGVLSAELA